MVWDEDRAFSKNAWVTSFWSLSYTNTNNNPNQSKGQGREKTILKR